MKYILSSLGFAWILVSCQHHNPEDQKILKQAALVHDRIISKEQKVKEVIQKLTQLTKELPRESSLIDSLRLIKDDYSEWQKLVIEVPGHEDSHEHHNHDHESGTQVSAKDMLDIQLYLEEELGHLSLRTENLLIAAQQEIEAQ